VTWHSSWWQEGDDSHDDWRNLKQVSDTADDDMEDQLTYLFRMAELSLEACEEGYGDDEEAQEKCEKKETRKMCYMYESMSQLCDSTLEQVRIVVPAWWLRIRSCCNLPCPRLPCRGHGEV